MAEAKKPGTRTVLIALVVGLVVLIGAGVAWKLTRNEGSENPIPEDVRPTIRAAVVESLATELDSDAIEVERALKSGELGDLARSADAERADLLETARIAAREALEEASEQGEIEREDVSEGVQAIVDAVERKL